MTPFAAVVAGGGAGLGGAALAHVTVALLDRAGSETWLKGPYGPPFFNISVYTGLFYGAIGGAVGRRARELLIGLLGPFLGIVVPMFLATRLLRLGLFPDKAPSIEWQLLVAVVYMLAIWGTIAALGASAVSRSRGLGAGAAIAASLAGYGLLALFLKLVPSYGRTPWNPAALAPSPVNLMDGLLSGAAIALAVVFVERRNHAR